MPTTDLVIEKTEESEDNQPTPVRYDISAYPTDFTVKVMFEKWHSGQLVIPDFQRKFVWSLPQASRLIESFLMGLPIPQVFLYKERGNPEFLVVDGQQRLASIAAYYQGRFKDKAVFKLRGVAARWEGKAYDQLDPDDRSALDDSTLRSIVIQQLDPRDNSSIYRIFERLNTGGTQLNPMEIRKAVFHGSVFDMLDGSNRDESWRFILGTTQPDSRLRDIELIVRILALASDWEGYRKPMKSFLTDYLSEIKEGSHVDLSDMSRNFARACELVVAQLGPRPFHLRARLNVAALDSVMATAIVRHGTIRDFGDRYRSLLKDDEFQETVTHNTSDAEVLKKRFLLVRSYLA